MALFCVCWPWLSQGELMPAPSTLQTWVLLLSAVAVDGSALLCVSYLHRGHWLQR